MNPSQSSRSHYSRFQSTSAANNGACAYRQSCSPPSTGQYHRYRHGRHGRTSREAGQANDNQ